MNINYKTIFKEKNITNLNNLFEYIQNEIKYGWIDQDKKHHSGINSAATYLLQSPEETLKNQIGICWDITELCRCFFENMTTLKYETYYLFYDDNKGCPSHSILVFYDNDKVYWFEPMFNSKECYHSGIHEFDNIKDLLEYFEKVFIKNAIFQNWILENYDKHKINIYKYKEPKYHINGYEMRNHVNHSEKIKG